MNPADARDDPSSGERTEQPARPSGAPGPAPVRSVGWILRSTAFVAAAAGIASAILAPGVRGNASESVVVWLDLASSSLSCLLLVGLLVVLVASANGLLKEGELGALLRVALIVTGSTALIFTAIAARERLPPAFAVGLSVTATVAALVGSWSAARVPHTRAAAGVLLAFAFAAIARLAAWILATRAGDVASVQMFSTSRWFATSGVIFEASGQLVAVTWLGTRSRSWGQLGSTAALAAAFAVTFGVAHGMHADAELWQAIVHTALADAPGIPQPYRLDAIATFLVPASLFLALATAVQPKQEPAMLAVMALALVSRGAFDAPLRALCAVAAAQWAVLASLDGRAMWRTLLAERARREEQ